MWILAAWLVYRRADANVMALLSKSHPTNHTDKTNIRRAPEKKHKSLYAAKQDVYPLNMPGLEFRTDIRDERIPGSNCYYQYYVEFNEAQLEMARWCQRKSLVPLSKLS